MKKIHWLVIVIACCAPPCLWSACDTVDEQEPYEIVQDCDEFYQALIDEWAFCSDGNAEIKENLSDMREQCEHTTKSMKIPIAVYNECVDVGIGCDMATGHVVVIEPCFILLSLD